MASLTVYWIETRPGGFECSMDGFVAATEEAMMAILFLVTMVL